MNLRPVPRHEIYACWDFVRTGLLRVAAKCKERYGPEDVFLALHTTETGLFLIEHETERLGFAVITTRNDPDGKALFVWILWGLGLAPHEPAIFAELEKLAVAVGCKRIRWESPRNWSRWGKRVRYVYERDL